MNDKYQLLNYQQFAKSTAIYPNMGKNWHYPLIGLTGELGELANNLKKTIRDDNDIITKEKRELCLNEIGDIFWYLVMLCYELEINPNQVIENNIRKLTYRKETNTIHDTKDRVQ